VRIEKTLSRREAALVACALLIPVPLLAQSGLSVPLPSGIERSLSSLVTISADDAHSGTQVTGDASAVNENGEGSSRASLSIGLGDSTANPLQDAAALLAPPTTVLEAGSASSAAGGNSGASAGPAGAGTDGGGPPTGDDPGEAGHGGDAGPPGDPDDPEHAGEPAPSGAGGGTSAGPTGPPPSLPAVSAAEGSRGVDAGVRAGTGAVDVDLAADESGTGGDALDVHVAAEDGEGSSTGVGVTLPVPGL
jgi:hypothetical protein